NDTLVAENQPLQLSGSGGEIYKWSPPIGLSSDNISNPVAILQREQTYLLSASIPSGCFTYDTINVKVYKGPTIYVPSAFSPNHDGNNDMFRFLAVGMTSLDFFQVYNRYGQMVYSSKELHAGWDGAINGNPQPSGTYVWTIKGRDYLGNIISKKGTVVLIR
ncbi:MAG TPA: gliding motility-associated C-terminal domain-containing protein, partial [Flavitalea sp.]|nr:gliding motility-associated C-terminal domain-containing protein [Flavitalea sp.]